LPPLRIEIPDLGVDVPVVLSDPDHLPHQKLVGWLFKSAFPGTAGNLVLMGHLDGPAAIFGRLDELQPGDVIRVSSSRDTFIYVVDETMLVSDDEVRVLAPSDAPIVTLITCAGDWNPDARTDDKRLVVSGHYARQSTDAASAPSSS
jgi:LPXTG-site transpeptidase (sortase) family protein